MQGLVMRGKLYKDLPKHILLLFLVIFFIFHNLCHVSFFIILGIYLKFFSTQLSAYVNSEHVFEREKGFGHLWPMLLCFAFQGQQDLVTIIIRRSTPAWVLYFYQNSWSYVPFFLREIFWCKFFFQGAFFRLYYRRVNTYTYINNNNTSQCDPAYAGSGEVRLQAALPL